MAGKALKILNQNEFFNYLYESEMDINENE